MEAKEDVFLYLFPLISSHDFLKIYIEMFKQLLVMCFTEKSFKTIRQLLAGV